MYYGFNESARDFQKIIYLLNAIKCRRYLNALVAQIENEIHHLYASYLFLYIDIYYFPTGLFLTASFIPMASI